MYPVRPIVSADSSTIKLPILRTSISQTTLLAAGAAVSPLSLAARPLVRYALTDVFGPSQRPTKSEGLFSPGDVTLQIHSHASVFTGGIRAVVLQAMHPEVVAGVMQHSRYQNDPLGRLRRTSQWVVEVTYSPREKAYRAIDVLKQVHEKVQGTSHRGFTYQANDPALLSWVHNTMVESFLVSYDRLGPGISPKKADTYVREQLQVGERLGCSELPQTYAELSDWVENHGALATSPGLLEVLDFLTSPPLPRLTHPGYHIGLQSALAMTPQKLVPLVPKPVPGALTWGRVMTAALEKILHD